MTILIAVASKHGSTREIAEVIAEQLSAENVAVDVRNAGEVNEIAGYEAVILGGAIYAGGWLPDAKRFAERHRGELAKLPVWVFSSGPLGEDDRQPHDDPQQLAAPLGQIRVRDHRVFVGKLDRDKLGLAERLIVKVVKAPYGDFREWEAIREWAREIAAALQTPAASGTVSMRT